MGHHLLECNFLILIYMSSQTLLPITNPAVNTINEVDENGTAVYETLRMQFIRTSPAFDERNIAETIHLYLENQSLCTDPIIGTDDTGTTWEMVANNSQTAFQKNRRVYKLQTEFIVRVVDPMIQNLQQVEQSIPTDTDEHLQHKSKIIRDILRLEELKQEYLRHDACLRLLEVVKYLC